MEATSTTIKTATNLLERKQSKYDPTITIRVPRAVRLALEAIAKDRQETMTTVLLEGVKELQLFASEEGRSTFERLRLAVTESTSIHKSLPLGEHVAWFWHGLEIRNYGTSEKPYFVHLVKQREHMTRADAIRAYTEELWKEWALLKNEAERSQFMEEVTDTARHLFLLAFVDFKTWKSFPSSYEAEFHRLCYVMGQNSNLYKAPSAIVEPVGAEEVQYLGSAFKYLLEIWKGNRAEQGTTEVLQEGSEDGEEVSFTYYPHIPETQNVESWARQLVQIKRQEPHFELSKARVLVEALEIEED
jgi:hypothetical protein